MASQQSERSNLRFMLRALRYRNYRLFFGGQIVSLIGTWLSSVASSWLVYRLATADEAPAALLLGVVGFAGQIPVFLLAPAAGVWIDRWNRHTILLVTQAASMAQSFVLAALALTDIVTIPQLIALNALQGLVNAWDIPARQAFTVEMVEDRDDLSNAIALNSSMMQGARLVGPAVAGYLIYAFGEGVCFLIDGVSYLGVIAALAAMRLTRRPASDRPKARAFSSLLEGVRYAFGFRPIRTLILMVAVTSLVVMSQSTLMPIFAAQVLDGHARTLGLLLGASGVGALAGSLYLASRSSVLGLGRLIAISCTLVGSGMIAFSFSRSLWLSLPLLTVIGFALLVQIAASNTLVQTIVEDDKRGRVMALFTMAFLGVAPLGSLLAGAVASSIGAATTLAIDGAICLVVAGTFAWRLPSLRPLLHPIYVSKGILPQVVEALEETEMIARATHE